MKVVFLNTWNAKMLDGIAAFIKEQSADADVFCFQEAYMKFNYFCKGWLPDYRMISGYKHGGEENDFPQTVYVRDNVDLLSSEFVLEKEPGTGLGIYMEIRTKSGIVHLCNFHGSARPGDKLDTPQRLSQSQGLIDFFKDKNGPRIIGGDFNLDAGSKSIKMFADNGYRDLIKEFNIKTTRNHLAWEMYPKSKQYYSDYVFVSPEVKVQEFSVPENEISDHLPMILKFD
jgi:exonuclease III